MALPTAPQGPAHRPSRPDMAPPIAPHGQPWPRPGRGEGAGRALVRVRRKGRERRAGTGLSDWSLPQARARAPAAPPTLIGRRARPLRRALTLPRGASCSHGGVLATGRAQVPLSRQPRDTAGVRGWRCQGAPGGVTAVRGERGFGAGEAALGPGPGLIALCPPGRSYIRYSQICAQAVRAAMKPQYKAEAERAAVATVKTVKPKKE